MNVAFASSNGKTIDEPFGEVRHFYVWHVDADEAAFLVRASPLLRDAVSEEAAEIRANAVARCAIVWALQVDDFSTAKLLERDVMPLSTRSPTPIREMLERLQGALRCGSSAWLRRAVAREAASPPAEGALNPVELHPVR